MLASLMTVTSAASGAETINNTPAKLVTEILNSKQHPVLQKTDFTHYLGELKALYHQSQHTLLWLKPDQAPDTLNAALELLSHADSHGLNPADYDAEILNRLLKPSADSQPLEASKLASYDTALSAALLHFIHDLHEGRIRPQDLSYPDNFGNKSAKNVVTAIHQAIKQNQLSQLTQQYEPKIRQYQQLKQRLNELRTLAAEPNFQPLQIEKSLRPGDSYSQLSLLKQRLIDLAASTGEITISNESYDGAMVEAVKDFQKHSGLLADGVIGKDTLTLLNQTRGEKIRQIELSMERLRWLPDELEGPLIIVNIPAFQLWAFNSSSDTQALNMKVIVGKAQENQTPMLFEAMQYLEFMPYWNIPKSILDKEIVPKLLDDVSYLQNQDIELVQRYSDDEGSEDIVDELRHGKLRARQRPGKKNPLGKVKFIFPNKEDVYLHDTPSHGLFDRSRRDFSHGCVRVSEAEKLAEFVLSRQSGWDRAAIQQAMTGDKTQRVRLKQSIPVLFFYSTSFVDQDNRLHFYRDIYGRDAELHKALMDKRSNSGKTFENMVTGKSVSTG